MEMDLPLRITSLPSPPKDALKYWANPWDGRNTIQPIFYRWSQVRYRRKLIIVRHKSDRLTIPEVFVYPQGKDTFLVYSPITGVILQTNHDGLIIIRSLQDTFQNPSLTETMPESYPQYASLLQEIGLLSPQVDVSYLQMPLARSLHLFLTSNCNLRCVYCFADAGNRPKVMPWEIARAGINYIVQEVQSHEGTKFNLLFQGNGEPFVAWPLLSHCVDYARSLAKRLGLGCEIRCATNGYLNAQMVNWAVKHIDHLYISLDGVPNVQDAQRPTADGTGSAARVTEAISQIDRTGMSYSLRATITAKSVNHMSDLVTYVIQHFPRARFLHVEPLASCARSLRAGWEPPTAEDFVINYLQSLFIAKHGGLPLRYSGYSFDTLTPHHCYLEDVGLAITPDGLITACQEVSTTDDHRAKHFIYGHYDGLKRKFKLDWDVYEQLMHRAVDRMTYCDSCMVRWHCAGECPAKTSFLGDIDDPSSGYRCIINQLLFRHELLNYFEERATPLLLQSESEVAKQVVTHRSNLSYASAEPASSAPKVEDSFLPTEVILLPTAKCNLRCRYCYVADNNNDSTMSWQIAQAAIDFVAANAIEIGTKHVRLGFHGGEPFMAWELMRQSIEYGRQRTTEAGLRLWAITYTNGYLNNEQRKWAVENLNQVVVSLDGPPQIQNLLRPTHNGSGSFEKVLETCRYFDLAGMRYHIRITVTAETTPQLPEIIRFFSELLACKRYSVEPLFIAGRCIDDAELYPPSPKDFANYFLQARAVAKEYGISLLYSGSDMEHREGRFCGAAGENFIVRWNGDVYSCYCAAGSDDPRCDPFRYGFFSRELEEFVFDHDKIERLRNRVWWDMPECRKCEAAQQCAGDCLVKAALERDMNEPWGTLRCQINRLLAPKC